MDTVSAGIMGLPEPARSTLLALARNAVGGRSWPFVPQSAAGKTMNNMTRVSGWYKRHATLMVHLYHQR